MPTEVGGFLEILLQANIMNGSSGAGKYPWDVQNVILARNLLSRRLAAYLLKLVTAGGLLFELLQVLPKDKPVFGA